MMRVTIAAGVAWACVLCAAIGGSEASTPTPASSTTAVPPTPTSVDVTYQDDETFSWLPVTGAAEYSLSGNVNVVRVNAANPICIAPLEQDDRSISIDVTLPGTAASYAVPLPLLPVEDKWFTATMQLDIRATDDHGTVLASGRIGHIAETQCPGSSAQPLPTDEKVARCVLAPNTVETTSDAARAHGQRTFDGPNGATRIYVGLGGSWSCISLSGIPPLPEFAPDVIETSPGVSAGDPPPTSAIQLPQTGVGSGRSHTTRRLVLLTLGAAAGMAYAGAFCARRAGRVTRG